MNQKCGVKIATLAPTRIYKQTQFSIFQPSSS